MLLPAETPLTLASQLDGTVEIIRLLCLGGAHIDFRARDGATALHRAVCTRRYAALMVQTPWVAAWGMLMDLGGRNMSGVCPAHGPSVG